MVLIKSMNRETVLQRVSAFLMIMGNIIRTLTWRMNMRVRIKRQETASSKPYWQEFNYDREDDKTVPGEIATARDVER